MVFEISTLYLYKKKQKLSINDIKKKVFSILNLPPHPPKRCLQSTNLPFLDLNGRRDISLFELYFNCANYKLKLYSSVGDFGVQFFLTIVSPFPSRGRLRIIQKPFLSVTIGIIKYLNEHLKSIKECKKW